MLLISGFRGRGGRSVTLEDACMVYIQPTLDVLRVWESGKLDVSLLILKWRRLKIGLTQMPLVVGFIANRSAYNVCGPVDF
jgi:hypothetical protein